MLDQEIIDSLDYTRCDREDMYKTIMMNKGTIVVPKECLNYSNKKVQEDDVELYNCGNNIKSLCAYYCDKFPEMPMELAYYLARTTLGNPVKENEIKMGRWQRQQEEKRNKIKARRIKRKRMKKKKEDGCLKAEHGSFQVNWD